MNQNFIDRGIETRKRIMQFIELFIERNGYSPTVMEIADGSGLASTSTTQRHLNFLKVRGVITWQPSVARTIKIIKKEVTRVKDHPIIEKIKKTGYPHEMNEEQSYHHWGTDIDGYEILVGDKIIRLPNGEIILEDNLEDYLIEELGFRYDIAK